MHLGKKPSKGHKTLPKFRGSDYPLSNPARQKPYHLKAPIMNRESGEGREGGRERGRNRRREKGKEGQGGKKRRSEGGKE